MVGCSMEMEEERKEGGEGVIGLRKETLLKGTVLCCRLRQRQIGMEKGKVRRL